jgi:hypothetical protein
LKADHAKVNREVLSRHGFTRMNTEMARRIAALILMQPDLDANYEAVKAGTWPWPREA